MEMNARQIIEEIAAIKAIRNLNLTACMEYAEENQTIDSMCYKRIKKLEEKLKECE